MTTTRKSVSAKAIDAYWRNELRTNGSKWYPLLGDTVFENILEGDSTCCYACGRAHKNLTKCHIVPHGLGGSEDPSNMFLMCGRCHDANPDTVHPRLFFNWVKTVGHWMDQDMQSFLRPMQSYMSELSKEELAYLQVAQDAQRKGYDVTPRLDKAFELSIPVAGGYSWATKAGLYTLCMVDLGRELSDIELLIP